MWTTAIALTPAFLDHTVHPRHCVVWIEGHESNRLLHSGMRNIDRTQMLPADCCARMHERVNGAPTPSAVP